MGRFLLALSILLLFISATGFCDGDGIDFGNISEANKQKLVEALRPEIVRTVNEVVSSTLDAKFQAILDKLDAVNTQPIIPVLANPTINPGRPVSIIITAPRQYLLMEPGQSSQCDIVELIYSRNRQTSRRDIEDIVRIYFEEARAERVNHDIAIAQMLHATEYLTNVQRTAVYNYSGMLNASFRNMTTGIRAHIQHLKFYTEGYLDDRKSIVVDPRYSVLVSRQFLGTVKTLEDLCRKWSESPGYLSSIISKLDEIKLFTRR